MDLKSDFDILANIPKNLETSIDSLHVCIPKSPEPACVESMCMRYDHSFGLKRYIYSKQRDETDEEFECRREGTRRIMRQLYEEATGQGFFKR